MRSLTNSALLTFVAIIFYVIGAVVFFGILGDKDVALGLGLVAVGLALEAISRLPFVD